MAEDVLGFPTVAQLNNGDTQEDAGTSFLDASRSDPLHVQLATIMRDKITNGSWPRGSYIPSESELMRHYGVSRGTVRKAIHTLSIEGLLLPKKGSGTMVGTGEVGRPAQARSFSFAASLAESGQSYETQVLAHDVVGAPVEVARNLRLHAGDEALFTRRVRSVKGHPVVCQESWENLAACPGIAGADLTQESMFDAVERSSGQKIAVSHARCFSRLAGEEHAGYLACDPRSAVLVLEQVIELANGAPIEWSLTWLPPNQSLVGTSWQTDGLCGPLDLTQLPAAPSANRPVKEQGRTRKELELFACDIRREILEFGHRYPGMTFHYGGSLSMAEIVAVLFGAILHTGRDGTPWEQRDRLVLSKAHASLALFPAMKRVGLISEDDMQRGLLGPNAVLFKHPRRDPSRGFEMSGGSLGMGLGYAVGLAIALRRKRVDARVYCIVGDGESDEGSIWESAALAGHLGLSNLTVIIDANGMQLDGPTSAVLDDGPIQRKYAAFGFDVLEVDGHDVMALLDALQATSARPRAVVARTIKGRGVSAAEGNVCWHDKALSSEEYQAAIDELEAARKVVCHE